MEGESRKAERGKERMGQEKEEQRSSEDEAYESLTLQLGKHFRLNSISRVRSLVANPDYLGAEWLLRARRNLACIVFPTFPKVYRNCKWRPSR